MASTLERTVPMRRGLQGRSDRIDENVAVDLYGNDVLDVSAIERALPANARATLSPHQQIMAKVLLRAEENRKMQHLRDGPTYAMSDMAFYGDPPGTGKSLCMTALAMARPEVESGHVERFYTMTPSSDKDWSGMKSHVRVHTFSPRCYHSLLLIPSGLQQQWRDVITTEAGLREGTDFLMFTRFHDTDAWAALANAAYAVVSTSDNDGDGNAATVYADKPKLVVMTSKAYEEYMRGPPPKGGSSNLPARPPKRAKRSADDQDNNDAAPHPPPSCGGGPSVDKRDGEGEQEEAVGETTKTSDEDEDEDDDEASAVTAQHEELTKAKVTSIVWQRVFIDECDSIAIKYFQFPRAHFTWLVTASYGRMFRNETNTGNIKLWRSGWGRYLYDAPWGEMLVFACAQEFISRFVDIPSTKTTLVHYSRSALHMELQNDMPAMAVQALEAGEVMEAAALINCQTVSSAEGLAAVVTGKMREEIEKYTQFIEKWQRNATIIELHPGFEPVYVLFEGHRSHRLSKDQLERQLKEAAEAIAYRRRRIDSIFTSVQQSDNCPITFSPIETLAMPKCCSNKFEASALARAIQLSQTCPMCRHHPLTLEYIGVVVPLPPANQTKASREGEASTSSSAQLDAPGAGGPFQHFREAVEQVTRAIFAAKPDAKVLVFSEFSMNNGEDVIKRVLGDHGTTAAPKGSAQHIMNALEAFRDCKPRRGGQPPVRVLMLNSRHLGSGHNLQCATHVVTLHSMSQDTYMQVVGRAQRWGRREPLHVIDIRAQ